MIDSSIHKFVEVLENNSSVFENPDLKGNQIQQIQSGQLFVQTEFKEMGDLAWNKVLLNAENHGWIVKISPPQLGIPEKYVSDAYQFHFRYKDLYIFIAALVFCIVGFIKFRIKPI